MNERKNLKSLHVFIEIRRYLTVTGDRFIEMVHVIFLRLPPHVSGYFLIHSFFSLDSNISTSTSIRIRIEFARPHVSNTNPTRIWIHSSTQDFSGNIGSRACVEVAILNRVLTVKNWTRSCFVTG